MKQRNTMTATLPWLLVSLLAVGCGEDADETSPNPDCGTQDNPTLLQVQDISPAPDTVVPGSDIEHAFTVIDAPGIFTGLTLVFGANHDAGLVDPPQILFTASQVGASDLRYVAQPITWANETGHVELNEITVYTASDGCAYKFPAPLFSYDIEPAADERTSDATSGDPDSVSASDTNAGSDAGSDAVYDAGSDAGTDTADTGSACSSSTECSSVVGADGGVVEGPNGVTLQIPAGALSEDVEISIQVAEVDAPIGVAVDGAIYQLEPAGLTFTLAATVSIPSSDPGAAVYWTDLGGDTFHRLPSSWEADGVSAQIDHFSLSFAGTNSKSGYCEPLAPLPPANGCNPVIEGDEDQGCGPGYNCYTYYDPNGTPIGSVCPRVECKAVETAYDCNNHIDDDCDGLPDALDPDCGAPCLSTADCGAGGICTIGFCTPCSLRPTKCMEPHGTPDPDCDHDSNEDGVMEDGLCMHFEDGAGNSCGTTCRTDSTCASDETCGNHMDDDCDGVVDNGCPTVCTTDAGCLAGEICDYGYCKACPGADFPDECSATSVTGQLDNDCKFNDNTETGVCQHIVDGLGAVCGKECLSWSTCFGPGNSSIPEKCGNHIDDDCDGLVDDGCVPCGTHSDCNAGESCQDLFKCPPNTYCGN